MSRTNYAGQYKKSVEEFEVIESESVEETIDEISNEPKYKVGFVENCCKLNVRSGPSIESDVICTITVGDMVEIDMSKSTSEWFNICTEAGIEGFCMSEYILVE